MYQRCIMKIQFDQEGMFRYKGISSHARNLFVFSQPCSMKFLEEVGSADERGTRRKKKQALFFSGNRGTRRKNRPYFTVETAEYMLTSEQLWSPKLDNDRAFTKQVGGHRKVTEDAVAEREKQIQKSDCKLCE